MRSRNPNFSQAGEYIEGIHYHKVSLTRPNYIRDYEIRFFFNFWFRECYNFIPFVFNLDPRLPNLQKFLHPNFDILASPHGASAFTTREIQNELSLLYYAADLLVGRDIALKVIFEYIHDDRAPVDFTTSLYDDLIDRLGVDKSKVEKCRRSVALRQRVLQSNRIFINSPGPGRSYPSFFLINGQYQFLPQSAGNKGRLDYIRMFKTIRFLVDK